LYCHLSQSLPQFELCWGAAVAPVTRVNTLTQQRADNLGRKCETHDGRKLSLLACEVPSLAVHGSIHKKEVSGLCAPNTKISASASLFKLFLPLIHPFTQLATMDGPSKYVTLISGDGFEFVVLRDAVLVSPIIKGMLDPRSMSSSFSLCSRCS
jgi:hypothetical protein